MPFDQSTILDLELRAAGADLYAEWVSTAPANTFFQLYVDREHVWTGKARKVTVPHAGGLVEVGAVLPSEAWLDLSAQLPTPPGGGSRLALSWEGGTFLAPAIAGFRVYLGDAPGAAVDFMTPAGTVAAYSQAAVTDGFGLGRFGHGTFGFASASYSWTSGVLAAGTWHAAVAAFDASQNEGTPAAVTGTVAGPPGPVPRNAAGQRVTYAVNRGASTPVGFGVGGFGDAGFGEGAADGAPYVTLSWLAASPA